MKKLFLAAALLALLVGSPSAQVPAPAQVHAQWSPNAATDGIIQYSLTVDASAPIVVLASTCSPTLCSVAVTIATFGAHTATLVAQNYAVSGDPTTLQNSPAASTSFSLGVVPALVSAFKFTK